MSQPRFNGVELTPETIYRTRLHFAALSRLCILEAQEGTVRVNDLDSYVAWQNQCIEDVMTKPQTSFTFLQRAHWLQTGESVPLLAKVT